MRHDLCVDLLHSMARESGIVSRKEVMEVEQGTSKKMDLVLYINLGRVWVDFTVVNPMADSYKGKDAIKTAEAKKRSKYDQCAANENVKFTPAGADVFGNLGDNLEGLLHTFAHHAYNTHPYSLGLQKEKWIGQRKKHMRERLVITIAYANYLLVDEAIMKVSHPGFTAQKLYEGRHRFSKYTPKE